jgi:hypothetical protein
VCASYTSTHYPSTTSPIFLSSSGTSHVGACQNSRNLHPLRPKNLRRRSGLGKCPLLMFSFPAASPGPTRQRSSVSSSRPSSIIFPFVRRRSRIGKVLYGMYPGTVSRSVCHARWIDNQIPHAICLRPHLCPCPGDFYICTPILSLLGTGYSRHLYETGSAVAM